MADLTVVCLNWRDYLGRGAILVRGLRIRLGFRLGLGYGDGPLCLHLRPASADTVVVQSPRAHGESQDDQGVGKELE